MESLKLSEIVDCFYNSTQLAAIGSNLLDALKNILGGEYLNYNEKKIRAHIKQCFEKFLKKSNNLPSNATPTALDRNIRNWLTDCYKGDFSRTIKSISRESILTLCFILSLSDTDCNKLLFAANQHPLHYGGDAEETIIAYCLKNHLDYTYASDLYVSYKLGLEQETETAVCDGHKSDEERTNILCNKLKLTVIDNSLERTSELLLNKMLQYNGGFSSLSNRTHFTINYLKTEYALTSSEFINFYDRCHAFEDDYTPLGSFESVKNTFDSIGGGNASANATQPTRILVILISILAWCKSTMQKSLSDFVDEILFYCNFHLLNANYNEDAFVLELSKFQCDKMVTYNGNNVDIGYNHKTKKDAFSIVVSTYLSRERHILSRYELTKEKQFFRFST